MKNLKLSSKLTIAFFMVNAIYILGIVALLLSYMMSNNRLNKMSQAVVTPQVVVEQARDAILRERMATLQLILQEPGSPAYAATENSRAAERLRSQQALELYLEVSLDEGGAAAAQELKSYYDTTYSDAFGEVVRLAQRGDKVAATGLLAASEAVERALDEKLNLASGLVHGRIEFFLDDAQFGLRRLLLIAAAAVALILIYVWMIIRYMHHNISRKIETITDAANLLAVGDLDIRLTCDSTDEIGRLTESFLSITASIKEQAEVLSAIAGGDLTVDITPRGERDTMNIAISKMIEDLNAMLKQILGSTNQVSSGAKQIADGAQLLAQGATEQAAAVDQVSASVAGVTQTTEENSRTAQKTAELMGSVNSNAAGGSERMNRLAQAVTEISEASRSISRVIKVIDDIAFQTNILALNASVEAARAGQHGKGFAVVADEVRNLAAKSAAAANETGTLIENSINKAVLGADIASEAVESFDLIVKGIEQCTQLIGDIAGQSQQQGNEIRQINRSIERVSQVVQQNSATSQESAASSEELSSQSEVLERLISQFRVKQDVGYLPAPQSTLLSLEA